MKKGTRMIAILTVLVIVLTAVGVVWSVFARPLSQTITAKGYAISVPRGWTSNTDGTIFNKKGEMVGKFLLIDEPSIADNTAAYSGFSVKTVEQTEMLTAAITKNTLITDQGKAVQYFIQGIPNPVPYAVSLTFLRSGVGGMTAERIAASFTIPELGKRPPQKNLMAPAYSDITSDKTAVFFLEDGTATMKNIHLVDAFISRQNRKESTGLDILCYEQTAEGERLIAWSHIESDEGDGYLYTYYNRGDGVYTYDNNPILFERIAKEILHEKGITAYQLKVGNAEAARLLEIPTNLYRDNAEALLELQMARSDEQTIRRILETILAPEQIQAISIQKTNTELRLIFGVNLGSNRAKLSKDIAVLFRLLSDVETIFVEEADGNTFRFQRNEILKWVAGSNADDNTTEGFVEFAEAIEAIPPAKAEGEQDDSFGLGDGNVVYSTTITFSPSTKVRHPKTGEMVAIGPYAERFGVSQYLNKPIVCVIRRSGMAFVGTAMVNGSVIYSQPLETEAAVQDAIKQLQAY